MNNTCCTPPAVERTETETAALKQKPRYRVSNSDDAYQIVVELPGVPKSAAKIHIEDSVLTVSTETKSATPESWKALHRELSSTGYELRLRLNSKVDDARMSAQLQDGLLTLTLPLRETAKPREIAIQ